MSRLSADIRFAVRMILKTPWMSAAAVLSLAGAMAVCIGEVSLLWDMHFAKLPFAHADRIVGVRDLELKRGDDRSPRLAVFREWSAHQHSFDVIGAAYPRPREIDDGAGGVVRYSVASMTATGFQVAGVAPLTGRALSPDDEAPGAEPVVVIGYRVWTRLFGSDPAVVGRRLTLDRESRRIVGVMPEGFRFPASEDVWVPLQVSTAGMIDPPWIRVFGRLAPGVSREQATAELESIRAGYAAAHPEDLALKDRRTTVIPYVRSESEAGADVLFYGAFMFMALVLTLACASVANLLLCRAMARQGELAVRAAMGASRQRLISQLCMEALAITSLAAVAGVGAASLGLRWFDSYIPPENLPFWIRFDVNLPSAVFAVLAALAAAVMAGVAPALRATRASVVDLLKDEQRTASGVRFGAVSGALTVAEVTVAVACLAAAGLAGRTLLGALGTRGHLPSDKILVADLVMSEASTMTPDGRIVVPTGAIPAERWPAVAEQLRATIAALPGVRTAALATDLPMRQHRPQQIDVDRDAGVEPIAGVRIVASEVTPQLFDVFNARLLAGRLLTAADTNGSERVAVVNRALAVRVFGGENPIGRRLRRADPDRPQPWLTVVGVIADLPMNPSANGDEPGYYTPFAQGTTDVFSVAVRVDDAPMTHVAAVRDTVRRIDERIEISAFQTHAEMIGDMLVSYKMMSAIFIALGAAALFLAVAGLYAVMSFSVTQRTREIGIRLALGASAAQVTRVILRRGMRQIAGGLALGSAGGWMLMRLLALIPIGTAPAGAWLLAAAAGLMAAAAVCACATPMLRILRTRPIDALRA